MSSSRGRSRQLLICGNVRVLASHFVVQKHVPSTWFPNRDLLSGAAPLCFLSFLRIFAAQHFIPPFRKQMIYFAFFPALVFVFLLPALSSGCHDNKLECHADIHPRPTSCERRFLGHINSWFHSKGCQQENRLCVSLCLCVCVCGGGVGGIWLTLQTLPVQVLGRGGDGFRE